ncbi:Os01g0288700, partial [Oryza sativa Japonica Group]
LSFPLLLILLHPPHPLSALSRALPNPHRAVAAAWRHPPLRQIWQEGRPQGRDNGRELVAKEKTEQKPRRWIHSLRKQW